ncbi:type III PLP-dependent enzyme [Dinoroseobacter sp. PD6]|uniref:type III PLP-dependent enzyme n=1 Tax=Dinoroseobacter sp. PD6 TaxID=3028384 RepID=UPI00237B3FAF|nr:type III PLP-dependent enzyme [Dinoroseobacter sp. PD6]MDD9716219.1 type III PLP-dependent enzyme [Dinoroseobacter sp. PD6]
MTMNAYVTGLARSRPLAPIETVEARLRGFIDGRIFDRPTLVLDCDAVVAKYHALAHGLGQGTLIHYAMKANPAPEILRALAAEGCGFDAASRGEIELALAAGATAARISFGNTIKRPSDIAFAHAHGIDLFAADAEAELDKIAAHAPGARVFLRVLVGATGADWPLSRKFGCAPDTALRLMDRAAFLGLRPVGLSFHVGSQTRDPGMWSDTLDQMAEIWHAGRARGHDLNLINIGGGFPAFYGDPILEAETYAGRVGALVRARFGDATVMAEPGRGLVAEAGMIVAEVLLVSRKSEDDLCRWVYLDIGKFSGLAETMEEAIRYQFVTPHDGGETGPCIMAGPSCDSADVLYEQRPVHLPMALQSGDRILIKATGAYTTTYSSVGFNGFPPLDLIVI